MATPGKIKAIEAKNGEPARDTVLRLLNEHVSLPKVARILDISDAALFRFVEKQHIEKEIRWVDKLPV